MKPKAAVIAVIALLLAVTIMCTKDDGPARVPDEPGAGSDDGKPAVVVPAPVSRPEDNGFCLVCHEDLQDEPISRVHEKQKVFCVDCHGPSSFHMEDEMLMTKPDVLFGRTEVEPFCRTCHERHKDPKEVESFRAKWLGRDRPNGRVISSASICTDCHGMHNIRRDEPGKQSSAADERAQWIPLFNGKDLSGFKAIGGAKWTVKDGAIVGTQGDNYAPGDLLTEKVYKDFLLTVTYRVEWPCNTGIWFRYVSPKKAYQADILEYKKPECYSGTLYCTGKMFLAMNTDKELVDRDGWNTISVRAEGDHLQVWLNGRQVADVHDDTSDSGHVGFQVHPGQRFGPMKIIVREAMIQPLGNKN